MRSVARRFGDTKALDGVDLLVRAGTVHALVGENGAGKSTLMRIAYGMLPADRGDILLFGDRPDGSVADAIARGAGMVHQHHSLIPNLTAGENLVLGRRGLFRPADAEALMRRIGDESGLRVASHARVSELSIVEQQRLEILKALAAGARLLILDEPTAVLAPTEIDELLRWLRAFADRGGSVVLVTHKLGEALAVADDVTVLRRGVVVATGPAASMTADALARAMFPDDATPLSVAIPPRGTMVVRATDLSIVDARGVERVRSASFELSRGEIVGIAAVEGSGHRELLAALARLRPATRGTLQLPASIAFIPADRARDALIPEFTLVENVALRGLGRCKGLMPWTEIADYTTRLIERFSIVAPSPATPARQLSGGNQQRLVVARELNDTVDLVVADNPTRGLDLRATVFVHHQLRDAAARGAAVVVHSSDLDELLGLASRVLVVFHGEVRASGLDRDEVGRAMLGANRPDST